MEGREGGDTRRLVQAQPLFLSHPGVLQSGRARWLLLNSLLARRRRRQRSPEPRSPPFAQPPLLSLLCSASPAQPPLLSLHRSASAAQPPLPPAVLPHPPSRAAAAGTELV